ncbi:peptidoglycan DD-metalloendopeptidase family protein [Iamia majanohamensis]|uniref:Peptidoglycan DD-metalloendopeptidase family protein n=1 Tax=Iamia majanohamensis TaxID=467976 RepID=A0AAF0BWL8_9ACTN|nr:peptidoglycan DD-metalloendopeptidase family protein [Iamia majanohamensis]WCO67960.1 peptidoglycan DD-metalloendopeptidase family protein [Iamia majanohamensis]
MTIGGFTSLPILAVGISGISPPACGELGEVADDGTPSILGPSTLTVSDLRAWWTSTGRGQPSNLGIAIEDLIALYATEGDAEGVRGDMALAQAVLETGHFTNSDTAINNFAGIAHYDGAASGSAFRDPIIGVRAQIQLLKKYALGNDTPLANPNVAPRAGASATTWGGLAGTWASATTYWTSLNSVYGAMLTHAGAMPDPADPFASLTSLPCGGGDLAVSGDYALPVERRWYDENPRWFTKPHHDYPAADVPVPVGTPLYAVTNGVVVGTPTSGRCGVGVIFNGDDRAQYTYCHGQPGTQAVAIGDRVTVGQHLLDSASTGNSTGPHLHFGIRTDGAQRCPQPFFVAIANGQPLAPQGLPAAGCTS